MQAELFGGFAVESLEDVFSVRDVSADGGVPAQREQVLVRTALLEVDQSRAVDDVQVDDGMQGLLRAGVAEFPGGLGAFGMNTGSVERGVLRIAG